MSSDPFRNVRPGDAVKISARAWDDALDCIRLRDIALALIESRDTWDPPTSLAIPRARRAADGHRPRRLSVKYLNVISLA